MGTGKTTFINALLAHKSDEKWAILVNEFGKIGIDGKLFTANDVAIKEVSGGCICCTSQLPLQIALVRLLADHRPARLIIEPTGLAHPNELIAKLSESHYQSSLDLQAVICVLNAAQWQQERYRNHDGYQVHAKYADIIAINRTDMLSGDELAHLYEWIHTINPTATIVIDDGKTSHIAHLTTKTQRYPQPKPL
ncbi:GTP-binding protein [Moraxella nasovis]|uniref:CobW family GTP-binding protein n=1 Tax=Moraxella nasovis TaxID=2904121 RepID=UPI001F6069ED|nr:GTP-binding protein [Moraxella nasovis]UNU72543.1 GTP-binding protein [Moraxella nasovis]